MITEQLFLKTLEKSPYGALTLKTPEGETHHFQGSTPSVQADLQIRDWRTVHAMLKAGDIGLGESYMQGYWDTSDLCALLRYGLQNQGTLERFVFGHKWMSQLHRILFLFQRNTLRQSPKNIQQHYDLSNAFYQLWLDEAMNYSSALFANPDNIKQLSLSQGQKQKHQRILQQLELQSGQHILEIGSGWGGFIQEALPQDQCVTGITLSRAQADYCQQHFARAMAEKQLKIELKDYRHVDQRYDSIVSVEMFEAVGQAYWPAYFETLKRCLNPKGRAVIQAITIDGQLFDAYKRSADFVRKHIFPGGFLPSDELFQRAAEQAGLQVVETKSFGFSYEATLKLWLERFDAVKQAVLQLGFDEPFIRKWRFYLAYCAAGFAAQRTNVCQYTLAHPQARE